MKLPLKRIAFIVNNQAFFVSHRLPLAMHALQEGCEVRLFTGQPGSVLMEAFADKSLREVGIVHKKVRFRSAGINPLEEILGLVQLIWGICRYRPDIVHCASPKGILYGGLAARFSGSKGLVLAVSGMGYAFTISKKLSCRRWLIRIVYQAIAHFSFSHPNLRVIVQNKDDQELIIDSSLADKKQVVLIPGSGINLTDYVGCSVFAKEQIVLLPARMIRDKGIIEFIMAAKFIHSVEPGWRFLLAGAADYDNPSAISPQELEAWQLDGVVEWLGHVSDMIPLFASAAIVCLPSYREGMPKALLEAAAAGCAIITTDVAGCRDVIVNGETGDLVPVGNTEMLSKTLLALMRDEDRRIRYGINGQKRAKQSFSDELVVERTFDIYRELLKNV